MALCLALALTLTLRLALSLDTGLDPDHDLGFDLDMFVLVDDLNIGLQLHNIVFRLKLGLKLDNGFELGELTFRTTLVLASTSTTLHTALCLALILGLSFGHGVDQEGRLRGRPRPSYPAHNLYLALSFTLAGSPPNTLRLTFLFSFWQFIATKSMCSLFHQAHFCYFSSFLPCRLGMKYTWFGYCSVFHLYLMDACFY